MYPVFDGFRARGVGTSFGFVGVSLRDFSDGGLGFGAVFFVVDGVGHFEVITGAGDGGEVGQEEGTDGGTHLFVGEDVEPHVDDGLLRDQGTGVSKGKLFAPDAFFGRRQHVPQVVAGEHTHDGKERRDHLGKVFRVMLIEDDQTVNRVVGKLLGGLGLIRGVTAVAVVLDEGFCLEHGRLTLEVGIEALDDFGTFIVAELEAQIRFHRFDDETFDAGFQKVPEVSQCRCVIRVDERLANRVDGLPGKPCEGIAFAVGGEQPRDTGRGLRGARPVADQIDADGLLGVGRVKVYERSVKELGGVHGLVAEIFVALGIQNKGCFAPEGALHDEGVEAAGLAGTRGAENEVVAFGVPHLLELVFVMNPHPMNKRHTDLFGNQFTGLSVIGDGFPGH